MDIIDTTISHLYTGDPAQDAKLKEVFELGKKAGREQLRSDIRASIKIDITTRHLASLRRTLQLPLDKAMVALGIFSAAEQKTYTKIFAARDRQKFSNKPSANGK